MAERPADQFQKMGEALTPKGGKRTWADNKLPANLKRLSITEDDMANANSYGDGKTLYIHGKTYGNR